MEVSMNQNLIGINEMAKKLDVPVLCQGRPETVLKWAV
jgi:hypothetical protein